MPILQILLGKETWKGAEGVDDEMQLVVVTAVAVSVVVDSDVDDSCQVSAVRTAFDSHDGDRL